MYPAAAGGRVSGKNHAFCPRRRWAGQGATHASHGWPWMDTPGLRAAGTAQRNARIQRFIQAFLIGLDDSTVEITCPLYIY